MPGNAKAGASFYATADLWVLRVPALIVEDSDPLGGLTTRQDSRWRWILVEGSWRWTALEFILRDSLIRPWIPSQGISPAKVQSKTYITQSHPLQKNYLAERQCIVGFNTCKFRLRDILDHSVDYSEVIS